MENKNLTIRAWLYDLPLTSDDENDRSARPLMGKPVTNAVVAQYIKDTGSEFKFETLLNIIETSDKLKADFLLSGRSLNTPFVNVSLGIEGRFHGNKDRFDSDRHKLKASFREGPYLKQRKQMIEVDILGMAPVGPVINQVKDVFSGTMNDTLTPGHILTINGDKIKIHGELTEVGVHIKNDSDETVAQITANRLAVNNPKELVFTIPADLDSGTYYIELVTQFTGGNNSLKEARTYKFPIALSVA